MFSRKIIFSFIIGMLFCLITEQLFSQPKITPALKEAIAEKGADEYIYINIRLAEQYDSQELHQKSSLISDPGERRALVIEELKEFNSRKQYDLISFLQNKEREEKVKKVHSFWLINLISCHVKPEVIDELLSFREIDQIDINIERLVIPEEFESTNIENSSSSDASWNMTLVNAPQAWEKGFSAKEVVVAILDTGVNYNHKDLEGNMWEHPDYPNHGYNVYHDNHNTMDYGGHGTHVAGLTAGNGTSGLKTGVAPDATIMAVQVLSSIGSGWEPEVWAGIEFAVENGAHVLNLSLSWRVSWDPDFAMWRSLMDNALAAGVISAVASGNSGTLNTPLLEVGVPGSVPPPWLHPDQTLKGGLSSVVSVGSTTYNDQLSSFSSKGPSSWGDVDPYNDYPYDPEMGLIRPDIVAPGSGVTSLTHDDNSGYTEKSGTSMSSPTVAGAMALILAKNPYLTPAQVNQILEESAHPLSENKSNMYGSGRLDALAAIKATPFLGVSQVEVDDSQGNNDGKINPGELIKLNVVLENTTDETFENVLLSLDIPSVYSHLLDSIVPVGTIGPGETIELEEAFPFEVSDTIPGGYMLDLDFTVFSEDTPGLKWSRKIKKQAYAPNLQVVSYQVDDSETGNSNGRLDPGELLQVQVEIENKGQLASEIKEINFKSLHPVIHVKNDRIITAPLHPGEVLQVEFDILVHENVPQGFITSLKLGLMSGAYRLQELYPEKIGMVKEDWETGGFEQFAWKKGGDADWHVTEDESFEGTYSARSGDITHEEQTTLSLEYEVMTTDTIAFYRKVSSENNRDWLEFYIDGELADRWSGFRDWTRVTFPVESGTREFKWVYKKDPSTSIGQDCAWIDHIELPAKAKTTVVAGFDSGLCGTEPAEVKLDGFATRYDFVEWSTQGDGTFSSNEELNPIYYPGDQDIYQGQVEFNLEVSYEDEPAVSDGFLLEFLPEPEVSLGPDTILCDDQTLLLDAGEEHYAYVWFDGSMGQTYLVDPANFDASSADIWVIVYNEQGCLDSDTINVIFDECVGLSYTEVNEAFRVYPNPAQDNVRIAFRYEDSAPAKIALYNISGQKVREKNTGPAKGLVEVNFDLSGLRPGIYIIKVETSQFSSGKQLIIQ